LIALERQGDLKAIPPFDVVLIAEKGAEALAYKKYRELTAEGKRVNLFCGDENAKILKREGTTLLKVTKKGVQEI
jgi:hypothetical protein